MPGIGLKTAAALIKEYGSLDQLLDRAGDIKQPKRARPLLANIDQARLSRRLVALEENVPVPVPPLDDLGVPKPDPQMLVGFSKSDGVQHPDAAHREMLHVDPEAVKPDPALLPGAQPHAYTNAAGRQRRGAVLRRRRAGSIRNGRRARAQGRRGPRQRAAKSIPSPISICRIMRPRR